MSKLNNTNEGEYIEKQLEKTLYILFKGRCSNRKSNTLHNKLILKANCQLFFLTQFVRLYFVLPCTLSLTVFVRLYFVLQPQVFQLVPRQYLILKSCGCFSPYSFQSFSRCFLFCRFIRRCSHPRVEFLNLASHSFQFGLAHAAFPFYSSSYLQQFGFFFILSNTVFFVIQFSLQAYVLQSFQKILYFFSKKEKLQYRFRFDFAITTVGFQFI